MNHIPLIITAQQRANLITLAKGLMGEYGPLKANFDIKKYTSRRNNKGINCGAAGCAVGHGPYFGIKKHTEERWGQYCKRCFISYHKNGWDYLFSGHWGGFDNTPEGAAKRIIYSLKYGVPENLNTKRYSEIVPLYSHLTLADLEGLEV